MINRQEQNAGTQKVRKGLELNQESLTGWMRVNVEGFNGPLQIEQFKGGQSNPTYKLTTPGRAYVLRRKPPGGLVEGAHAIEREYRVIAALHGTGFPVATPFGLCEDTSIIGTAFYVMGMVEGRSIWDTSFPDVADDDRADHFWAMNATLARLHDVDWRAAGLTGYGKIGSYVPRQIKRWTTQLRADQLAERDPNFDTLAEWLEANVPPDDETTLIHGDLRCDNIIFHQTEPRVAAVLDWELSTLGDPLADFAYNAMIYRLPPDLITGLKGVPLAERNIPSEDAYLDAYCRARGRSNILHYEFYVAFNMFRLSAILHGIKSRMVRGSASSAHAGETAGHARRLTVLGMEQAGLRIRAK